jgi:hypothetical protein
LVSVNVRFSVQTNLIERDLRESLVSEDAVYLKVVLQALKFFTNKKDDVFGERVVSGIIHTLRELEIESENIPLYKELVADAKRIYPNASVWKK